MDYKPRYAQPFTLAEAVALDVSIITEEIARLQNSLKHLGKTQEELREFVASEDDPEITETITENEVVIASQEERISILKMALAEKGVNSGSHYDLVLHEPPQSATTNNSTNVASSRDLAPETEEENGVYL